MNLLIVIEGNEPDMPATSFLDQSKKIWLLYLSPRIKAQRYNEKLCAITKNDVEIQNINIKKIVNFESLRQVFLEFISSLPGRFKFVDSSSLIEYLNVQGLNMWWTSGIVEATPYKQNVFQNYYYLSAVQYTLEVSNIDTVWFQLNDPSLERDLESLLERKGIKYFKNRGNSRSAENFKAYLKRIIKKSIYFFASVIYLILFKLICPNWVKPRKPVAGRKNIHLFYSTYPYNWNINSSLPIHKIFKDLPSTLTSRLGGEAYYLSDITIGSMLHPFQLANDVRRLWKHKIRFVPMIMFLSLSEIANAFLSPVRKLKYFRLRRYRRYRGMFKLKGIDMFHTFDQAIRDSLLEYDTINNILHYHAFRRFAHLYGKAIFQVIYYIELHGWEVSIISGIRGANKYVPILGLQQSAVSPIQLCFFFPVRGIGRKANCYPLPDLFLCSGRVYKDLLASKGVNRDKIELVGHIDGQYLKRPSLSNESKRQLRKEISLAPNKKICLVACSIEFALSEGTIYLVKQVAAKFPEIYFLIKGHPDSPIERLLSKYNIDVIKNIKHIHHPISTLLPLSDYFLSTYTSVSQEALWLGIPQVNLDVGGVPQSNPLHLVPGVIADVETTEELMYFFQNTDKFHIPKEKCSFFIDDSEVNSSDKIFNILVQRFHKDSLPQRDRQLKYIQYG